MMRCAFPLAVVAILLRPGTLRAEGAQLESSNLPIVVINTDSGTIPDEPKVDAWMGIVDNGPGRRNRPGDPRNGYDGRIGIEIRGSSTKTFPKKSYALETRHADGSNRNTSLLGMPSENDWILYGPYSDKSLMRNVLACWLANEIGRYASRTCFCELVLDQDYRGVYVLMEKIKRDDGRVDIAHLDPDETSGDQLTGGYLIRVDRISERDRGWHSRYAFAGNSVFFQYRYPKADEIVTAQEAYIRRFVTSLEQALFSDDWLDPECGYAQYIDAGSFIDYLIVNEVARNVDAYRLSTYMHKDRDSNDGRLVMGPVWDFNLAFGNVNYDVHPSVPIQQLYVQGLQIGNPRVWFSQGLAYWWRRLLQDQAFVAAAGARWQELRGQVLQSERLDAHIDALAARLGEAQARNFQRWPVLGEHVWPNLFVAENFAGEVAYLREWLHRRIAWLDANLVAELRRVGSIPVEPLTWATEVESTLPSGFALLPNYPNPFNGTTTIRFDLPEETPAELAVFDMAGQRIVVLARGVYPAGRHAVRWDACTDDGQPVGSGVYACRMRAGPFSRTRRLAVIR